MFRFWEAQHLDQPTQKLLHVAALGAIRGLPIGDEVSDVSGYGFISSGVIAEVRGKRLEPRMTRMNADVKPLDTHSRHSRDSRFQLL